MKNKLLSVIPGLLLLPLFFLSCTREPKDYLQESTRDY